MTEPRNYEPLHETGPCSRAGATEESHLEGMAHRIGRLERTCRRWRLAGVGIGIGFLLLMGMAAVRGPEALEGEQFVLRDREGVMRAAWTIRPDQTPGLSFYDKAGKSRLSFDVGQNGVPGMNLYGPEGTLRAALAVRTDGTPGLCLADDRGKIRLSLDLGKDGSSGINLYNDDGALRAALAIRPDGTPGLGLFDEHGAIQRSFEIRPEDRPARRREQRHGVEPGSLRNGEPDDLGRHSNLALPAGRTVP